MSNKEDQKAKLLQAKKDLYNLGAVNTKIDEVTRLRDESAARLRQMREARNHYERYDRSESPRDPTPDVSDLEHSPESSNESSVDPWTVAEHKRPSTIPKVVKGKHPEDRAELVQNLSDREDDPSDDVGTARTQDESKAKGKRKKEKVSEMNLMGQERRGVISGAGTSILVSEKRVESKTLGREGVHVGKWRKGARCD